MKEEIHHEIGYLHRLRKESHTFEGRISILLGLLSFGSVFMILMSSWIFFFCLGPLIWLAALTSGAIAVLRDDELGYIGVGLGYFSFLLHMFWLFSY